MEHDYERVFNILDRFQATIRVPNIEVPLSIPYWKYEKLKGRWRKVQNLSSYRSPLVRIRGLQDYFRRIQPEV